MYPIHEMIKLVDGYGIFSIPADVDDAILPEISSELCAFIVQHNVPGLTFDLSNLHSVDLALWSALVRMILATGSLGVAVNTTGICAGIASTLALLGSDQTNIQAFGTLDRCMTDLRNRSKNHRTCI